MQTFLCYPDFEKSASVLDSTRLNKQLIECFQIYQVLTGYKTGWANHPCVSMWKSHVSSFTCYAYYIANECNFREIKNKYIEYFLYVGSPKGLIPSWINNDFCKRHQSALLFKTGLKAMVYDFSLLYETPVVQVNLTAEFLEFNSTHSALPLASTEITKHYPIGKSIYNYKKNATVKMVANAYRDYTRYQNFFGAIDHKIDYKWGVR